MSEQQAAKSWQPVALSYSLFAIGCRLPLPQTVMNNALRGNLHP
jgi:hypothetical protein